MRGLNHHALFLTRLYRVPLNVSGFPIGFILNASNPVAGRYPMWRRADISHRSLGCGDQSASGLHG
jgi:hypothetical protein